MFHTITCSKACVIRCESGSEVMGLKRRLNYSRRPNHFPHPIHTRLADETKDGTLLSSWICCCTLTCTMRLPVCMPTSVSALSSQASFFDVMSYHVVKGVICEVKMGNMTDGMLPISMRMKINTPHKGHRECVSAYVCVCVLHTVCASVCVWCCSVNKMFNVLFPSCFLSIVYVCEWGPTDIYTFWWNATCLDSDYTIFLSISVFSNELCISQGHHKSHKFLPPRLSFTACVTWGEL